VFEVNIDSTGERLLEARQVASPNCDARPAGCEVSLVVIHGISLPPGHYGGPEIDQLFTNRLDAAAHPYFAAIAGLRVSTHLLIRRDGELVQYVPFTLRAWHAGKSCYDGCGACNDFSIGIELEGQDHEAYTAIQYEQLAAVLQVLIETFPRLSAERVAGHSDVAPGRKTDPGPAFDWNSLQQQLALLQSQQVG
jgi:N-acetyl-anhydromuramoyl-L-alanine amidase